MWFKMFFIAVIMNLFFRNFSKFCPLCNISLFRSEFTNNRQHVAIVPIGIINNSGGSIEGKTWDAATGDQF